MRSFRRARTRGSAPRERALALVLVVAGASIHCRRQPPPEERPPPLASTVVPLPSSAPPAPSAPPKASVTLSPNVPADLPPNPTPADAATFAWQSFVAVNWPALATQRGVPDPNKSIGQPGDVVWHTWKAPEEIFLPNGGTPPDWNTYGGSLPPECHTAGAAAGAPILARVSKVPADSKNDAVERAKQAVGGTLTDQHGNLARYEIRMNKSIFDVIVSQQYYNVEGQNRAPYVQFPADVMEVKAAWRQITAADSPAVKARFARRDVWIYTPPFGKEPATCIKGEVGLVGLHVSHKTASRPQWVWATFEQVDNVPPFQTSTPGPFPYSFNNPGCAPAQCPPNQSTEKNGIPTGIPTQVTRVVNIGAAAQQANTVWQGALAGTVYQYYELIDVQWPQAPQQLPVGNPTPGLVASTVLETYVAESSCMNCHYTARTQSGKLSSDYSFMLAEAHSTSERAKAPLKAKAASKPKQATP